MDKIFEIINKIIQLLPKEGIIKVDVLDQLTFYGLYKTIKFGKNNETKPKIWNFEQRQKWNAWKEYDHLDAEYAKYLYVRKFGEYLKNLYQDENYEYYLNNGDFSIFTKLTEEEINILIDSTINNHLYVPEGETSENIDDDMKSQMLFLKDKILKIKKDNEL